MNTCLSFCDCLCDVWYIRVYVADSERVWDFFLCRRGTSQAQHNYKEEEEEEVLWCTCRSTIKNGYKKLKDLQTSLLKEFLSQKGENTATGEEFQSLQEKGINDWEIYM